LSSPTKADVSVVIPTYNRAALLDRALASVGKQTLQPLEVIVVDDGSSDDTEEVVARSETKPSYLHQRNRGVSAARNRGTAVARGAWIAFLDSDDAWMPDKLEAQMAAVAETASVSVCHTDEIWIRNGRRVNPGRRHRKHGGWIFRHCLPLCVISPSSVLLHRRVFDTVGGFDESLPACEDYDLWLRVCSRYEVLFVPRALTVKYGGHEDQLSRAPALDRFRIRALDKLLRSGELAGADRRAACETLLDKIEIYLAGVRRRGRAEEAATLEALRRSYAPFAGQPGGDDLAQRNGSSTVRESR